MTQPGSRDSLVWVLIPTFWAVLFVLGFPFPFTDDLWYIGAALQLHTAGQYANPSCPFLATFGAMDPFYAYPPLYDYVLAGWLKVAGVSRASLALFQCGAGAVACLGLWRLLRRDNGWFLPVGVTVTTATLLSSEGLRPDALGLGLLACGAWIMRFPSRLAWAWCGLALFLAVTTSPNFTVLLPFILGAAFFFQLGLRQASRAEYLIRAAILLGAAWVAFLLLLKLIDFQLGPFLAALNVNRTLSSQHAMIGELQSLTSWRDDLRFLAHAIEPLAVLAGVLALAWFKPDWMRRPLDRVTLVAMGLAGVALLGPALNSSAGMREPAFFSTMATLFYVANLRPSARPLGVAASCGVYLLFLFAVGRLLLDLVAARTATLPPAETILQRVDALHPRAVYIDEFALDAVYHYRLPPGVLDYHFSLSHLNASANPSEFPPGSVLVVSKQVIPFMKAPGVEVPSERIHNPILRRAYFYMMEDPYDFVIFHVGEGGRVEVQ
jgi:hypothetical protein